MDEVSNHCCYGKGAAQNLVFTNIQPSSAFHVSRCVCVVGGGGEERERERGIQTAPIAFIMHLYTHYHLQYQLETFTEGRTTTWAYEPFNGKRICQNIHIVGEDIQCTTQYQRRIEPP